MTERATDTSEMRRRVPKPPGVEMTARSAAGEYARLYHYTTLQGVFGILGTKQLWATHCKFLNDYSEIVLFRDRLIEFLRPHVLQEYKTLVSENQQAKDGIAAQGGLDAVVKHDAAAVVDAMYKATDDEIYIASFCGEQKNDPYINANGLLSQWRGYGRDGGFALVFRTSELEKLLAAEFGQFDYSPGSCLADVVYSDNEARFAEELAEYLPDIADYVKQLFQNMRLKKEEPPDASRLYPAFIHCVARYKHRGFKEENEVRIVGVPARHGPEYLLAASESGESFRPEKERKFRDDRSRHIPYIEMFASLDTPLPIEKIIVGPHKDKETRASALRVMVGNTDIQVTVSDIPYVC